MTRSRIHLFANLLLGLVPAAVAVVPVWRTGVFFWLKITLTLVVVFLYPFFTHLLAPKLTGAMVDRLCDAMGIDK